MGKRGCQSSDLTALDADLKSRLVSTEELSLSVSSCLRRIQEFTPAIWWDRSCDVALIVGTFVHGLGNYEAMQNDEGLPFSFRIRKFSASDEACVAAQRQFQAAAAAARGVFDNALEAAKTKSQLEVQAAVAAAAAASSEREKDALALREGGAAADAVISNMPEQASDHLFDIDGDDSHFVTLPRLQHKIVASIRSKAVDTAMIKGADAAPVPQKTENNSGKDGETNGRRKTATSHALSMPDARVLDHRLSNLLTELERNAYPDEAVDMDLDSTSSEHSSWPCSDDVSVNIRIRSKGAASVYGAAAESDGIRCEYRGIGFNGTQCGASHRSLDDGTDFSIGAASVELSQVAYGPDAPRYLRSIGVPMNLTRFALGALINADDRCVESMLSREHARYNGTTKLTNGASPETKGESSTALKEDATKVTNGESSKTKEESGSVSKADAASSSKDAPEAVVSTAKDVPEAVDSNSKPKDESYVIPKVFADSPVLRASVCVVTLHYGFPLTEQGGTKVDKSLWTGLREQSGIVDDVPPDSIFHIDQFKDLVKEIADDVEVPDSKVLQDYVESCLIPHCLRLCVMGNGPRTMNRGSKGKYETAVGISLYPEHSDKLQSPLPDPCLALSEQSLEALAYAFAILRRVRLIRASSRIASGGHVSMEKLDEVLRSPFSRKSMTGLPVWWCPWIHDAALLLHAGTRGLFAVLRDRSRDANDQNNIAFSHNAIVQHTYSTFAVEENLPRAIAEDSPPEAVTEWIEIHAKQFPSANVLERRLAFLCAKVTEMVDCGFRYDNLPMFDHGGWPRN